MRRTSVSLPTTKQVAYDPYEKPDRYDPKSRSMLAKMKDAWSSQAQRARYIKIGAVLFTVVCLFWLLTPKAKEVYNGGEHRPPVLS